MSQMLPDTQIDTGERPTIAGNWKDTDAEVEDAHFRDSATPPAAAQLPIEPSAPVIQKRPITRLISGTITLSPLDSSGNQNAPVPLLPADADRQHLIVRAYSATPTDSVRLADDPGKLMSPAGAPSIQGFRIYPANPYADDYHTGPVWVSAADAAGAVVISYSATTL